MLHIEKKISDEEINYMFFKLDKDLSGIVDSEELNSIIMFKAYKK